MRPLPHDEMGDRARMEDEKEEQLELAWLEMAEREAEIERLEAEIERKIAEADRYADETVRVADEYLEDLRRAGHFYH